MVPKMTEIEKKLIIDIKEAEDYLNQLYDEIHEVERQLSATCHKQFLMKLYKIKIAQVDEDITLKELLKIISHDIVYNRYDDDCNVMKTTKVEILES